VVEVNSESVLITLTHSCRKEAVLLMLQLLDTSAATTMTDIATAYNKLNCICGCTTDQVSMT
jgi:hypothetical protein